MSNYDDIICHHNIVKISLLRYDLGMNKADLHLHTHFSDGVHSVDEIFEKAKEAGLTTIAITDHNWSAHIKENQKKAIEFELDYIQGIEISAIFEDSTVHILGYSRNFDLKKLTAGLQKQVEGFTDRSRKIVKKINDDGKIKIDFANIKRKYKGCIQNFPVMVEVGKALNMPPLSKETTSLYHSYCIPYGDYLLKPVDVVKLIKDCGGVAVLAHPAVHWRKMGREKFDRLFDILLEAGIDGVEAIHSDQDESEEKEIFDLAKKHQLLITGGSDFHGLSVSPTRHVGKKGLNEDLLKTFLAKLDGNKK